ncbi:DUF1127 domain-containing protein [uncultured Neptuniibacter sp.]|uniref:DUF1127 domain-containing protein n=1 Tax=uncultured Neptuniibacter sp. TaxID=502143 RepID=UPI0026258006|nr:DUF1127 domain-containing protein [uncultured Neptuniibacter sp.]
MNYSQALEKQDKPQLRTPSHNSIITLQRFWALISRWRQNYTGRRQLKQLDHSQLKDIGISRSEALSEANKPFWRR